LIQWQHARQQFALRAVGRDLQRQPGTVARAGCRRVGHGLARATLGAACCIARALGVRVQRQFQTTVAAAGETDLGTGTERARCDQLHQLILYLDLEAKQVRSARVERHLAYAAAERLAGIELGTQVCRSGIAGAAQWLQGLDR
jgi:hypothetical protein